MNVTLDAFLEPGKNANGSDIRITKAHSYPEPTEIKKFFQAI